jgi:hypothetical protein
MVVTGFNVSHYKYAISDGNWVAPADVDEGFQGLKFSPTMGACVPQEDRSFSHKERGWVYDQASGSNVGTFESVGAFKVNPSGTRFAGAGTFTMADRNGVVFYKEPFTAVATKVAVSA